MWFQFSFAIKYTFFYKKIIITVIQKTTSSLVNFLFDFSISAKYHNLILISFFLQQIKGAKLLNYAKTSLIRQENSTITITCPLLSWCHDGLILIYQYMYHGCHQTNIRLIIDPPNINNFVFLTSTQQFWKLSTFFLEQRTKITRKK